MYAAWGIFIVAINIFAIPGTFMDLQILMFTERSHFYHADCLIQCSISEGKVTTTSIAPKYFKLTQHTVNEIEIRTLSYEHEYSEKGYIDILKQWQRNWVFATHCRYAKTVARKREKHVLIVLNCPKLLKIAPQSSDCR